MDAEYNFSNDISKIFCGLSGNESNAIINKFAVAKVYNNIKDPFRISIDINDDYILSVFTLRISD